MTNDEFTINQIENEQYPFDLVFEKMFFMTKEKIVKEEDFKISYDRYLNKIPKDEIDSITDQITNMIFSTRGSDRNKRMALTRFKEKITYREIGERFGVTMERARQITSTVFRRVMYKKEFAYLVFKILTLTIPPLLNSSYTKYLIFHKYGYLPHYDELEKYFPDKIVLCRTDWFDENPDMRNIAINGLRHFIDEKYNEIDQLRSELEKSKPESDGDVESQFKPVFIEDLNLCARTCGALKSKDIHTVEHIITYLGWWGSLKSLKRIRGIGDVSFREIINALDKFNIPHPQ